MPIRTLPLLRSRCFLWPATFTVLWLLLSIIGVVAPSERFHIALPISWLLTGWLVGRWKHEDFRHLILPVIIAICAITSGLWLLIAQQARSIEGIAHPGEVVWKMLHISSIFICFSLWSKGWQSLLRLPAFQSTRWKSTASGVLRALAIASFAPFIFATFNAHRTKISNRFNPQSANNLPFETVNFRAEDGARLHGWWIPSEIPTRKTVVVCHGVGANASVFLGVAPFLHRAGFNVFFFDFRGHGDSSGHTVSFGWHEADDVRAACKYLQSVRQQNALALYGFSMGGGAVSLSFAPRFGNNSDNLVRAVVLDSTFAEFEPLVQQQFWMLPGSWQPVATRVIGLWSQLEIGVTPARIAPRDVIARVSPQPLLIIHGTDDQLISLQQARWLFAAARVPKQLHVVPGAGHCLCRLVAPEIYEERLTRWLHSALN